MRNIFLFIRRYFNFLLFIVLQIISVYFIFHYSKYHQAAFGNFSNQLTGNINKRYNNIQNYFSLKKTNDSLLKANERLYNALQQNFIRRDTTSTVVVDTLRIDSVNHYRKFNYLSVQVAANSVSAQNNFIVLSRGKNQNLKTGMGIVDANNAAVGVITDVSDDFAVVMSLLHKDSHLSAKLLKTGETGTLNWDGKTANLITLTGISKGTKMMQGDSVITSGFSTVFPKGILIGRIEAIYNDNASTSYKISVRTAANFFNLQYAYAIDNKDADAINKLLDKAGKQL
ncbi:MAG: rod shape-determining protein MreC [Ferruginibacter sp.]